MRETAVSVDGDGLTLADLVLLGVVTGEWREFECHVACGLVLEREHGEEIGQEELRPAATEFRYAHGLVSAAEFRAWLDLHGMTVAAFSSVLRRRLLRRRFGLIPDTQVVQDQLMPVLLSEAFCDGILTRLADAAIARLAAWQIVGGTGHQLDEAAGRRRDQLAEEAIGLRAAGIADLGEPAIRERLGRLLALEAAIEQLRTEIAGSSEVERRVVAHALDWLRLRGELLNFTSENAAREARLLMTADAEAPQLVAERAGVTVHPHDVLLWEAPEELRGVLPAATAGDVIGPWHEDGAWRVMRLADKVPPSPADGALRRHAIEELLGERIERRAAGRTTRHAAI